MGSGIIFNNGGSGGGTTINPTNNFIPVRSNATTFVDSCLWQVNADALRTVFAGTVNGLNIDHSNRQYALGQFALENQTYIAVNDFVSTIISYSQGSAFGFVIDRANNYMLFGDNASNYLFINANTKVIDFVVGNALYAELDAIARSGFYGATGCTFRFDATQFICSMGDYNGNFNSSYIAHDDQLETTTFQTEYLVFNGSTLQSNSSSGNSGEHLVITLNGTQYKIALQNP